MNFDPKQLLPISFTSYAKSCNLKIPKSSCKIFRIRMNKQREREHPVKAAICASLSPDEHLIAHKGVQRKDTLAQHIKVPIEPIIINIVPLLGKALNGRIHLVLIFIPTSSPCQC